MNSCPICKLEDNSIKQEAIGDKFTITCPRCSRFTISGTANAIARGQGPLSKLSSFIRNHNEQKAEPVVITDLKQIQSSLPDYSPREKQTILLQNIERKTEYPGKAVSITLKYDIPLAWASAEEELRYYIQSLIERNLLRRVTQEIGPVPLTVAITADGWDYLEQHDRNIEERTQAFVAMSFSEDLKSIWEGPIKNAITKAGYKPHRVDAEPHIDRIDVKIISEIKNSRFIVADITEQKRGVYFEAGFALGLGLPVIWCVRKDDLENAHFDTRQYNHIVWENADDLENQLYHFICAIIGKGKGV